jgi:hypothetical protein
MKFDELKVGHLYKGKYIALIAGYGAMSYSIKHMWMIDGDNKNWELWGDGIGYIDKDDWDHEENRQEPSESDLTQEIHSGILIHAIFEKPMFLRDWAKAMSEETEGKVIIT